MIRVICALCKTVFMAPAILGLSYCRCPKCGSDKVNCAVKK